MKHLKTKYMHADILDYSGTVAGTVLLFMFMKNASIVMNFDADISHLFTHSRLAVAILNLPHDIWVTGLFLQMRGPMDRH